MTFNSVGYPGAQASFVNKFNNKLLANDLVRINPQIVMLSFGTNEASNESLDLDQLHRELRAHGRQDQDDAARGARSW